MARRRMFSLDVVDTDRFACMSKGARYLYYELGVRADDDGFIGSPMRIIKMTESTTDDLEELTNNGFIIKFNTGIIVIKDWLQNNQIRKDRYKPTVYIDERHQISIDESAKKYVLTDNQAETNGLPSDIPNDNQAETNGLPDKSNDIEKESKNKYFGKPNGDQRFPQNRLDKDNLGKNNLDKDNLSKLLEPEQIVNLFNDICKSYEPVRNYMVYSASLSTCICFGYTEHDYRLAFTNAENSDYLKGLTENKTFQSKFDWILEHLEEIKNGKYN